MPILKTEAYVLRLIPFSNSSHVIVLLGEGGDQIRMLAKGIRRSPKKGFEGGLDLLSRGQLVYYPRAYGNLSLFKEWDEHEYRLDLAARPGGLEALSYVAELAENLSTEEEPCEGLFEAVEESLDELRGGGPVGGILLKYTWKGLGAFGVGPEVSRCASCAGPLHDPSRIPAPVLLKTPGSGVTMPPLRRGVYFSPRDGGAICGSCARKAGKGGIFEVGSGALEALQGLLAEGPVGGLAVWRPLRTHAQQLARVLTSLVHHALGREMKTLAFARGAIVSDALHVEPA